MGLLLMTVAGFLVLGGAGIVLRGTIGAVLVLFALFWLICGIGFHRAATGSSFRRKRY